MKEASLSIPHLFRCPISLDLLKDPVTLCTGQTYDRSSIEKWLATGNLTCPITMQKLHDLSIVPNHTLRHLIHQWLQMSKQIDHDSITTVDSLISLKTQLESPREVLNNKLQALHRVQILSKGSSSCVISCMLQLGFLQILLELVFANDEENLSLAHGEFVEIALSCAVKMHSLGQKEALNVLKQDYKMLSFIFLLEQGTNGIKARLCDMIEGISSSFETKDLCLMLGNSPRVLQAIIAILHQNDPELSNSGAKAINSLCKYEPNIEHLVREEADIALLEELGRENSLGAESMAGLEKLLGGRNGKEELKRSPPLKGIQALVKMVFKVSDEGQGVRESALNSLMILCSESREVREEAIRGGVLSQVLLLLQSQCSARAKARARLFLKLLRSKWPDDLNNI